VSLGPVPGPQAPLAQSQLKLKERTCKLNSAINFLDTNRRLQGARPVARVVLARLETKLNDEAK